MQDITLKVDRTKTGYDIIVGKDTLSERERERDNTRGQTSKRGKMGPTNTRRKDEQRRRM